MKQIEQAIRLMMIPIVTLYSLVSVAQSNFPDPSDRIGQVLRQYGFDTLSTLRSRITETPLTVREAITQNGKIRLISHAMSEREYQKVERAFAVLPPRYLQIFTSHVRTISFVDSTVYRALTYTTNRNDVGIYDIVVNARCLGQDLSEWLTIKENTCYDSAISKLSVRFNAGNHDAIAYVLMHEVTHVVDQVLGLSEATGGLFKHAGLNAFGAGVWISNNRPVTQYSSSVLGTTRFRGGKSLPFTVADSLYSALMQTPFVSLYSTFSIGEDLADFLSVYFFTQFLKQKYVIEIRENGKIRKTYEPVTSPMVQSRFKYARLLFGE